MIRFTEEGETKIKTDLGKLLDRNDDVDAFYSD